MTREVLEECVEYERKWLAALEAEQKAEKKRTIARMEKLFENMTKRFPQQIGR